MIAPQRILLALLMIALGIIICSCDESAPTGPDDGPLAPLTWSVETQGYVLHDIWAAASGEMFIVGTGGIIHYDGNAWNWQETGLTRGLRALWGDSPTDLFAAGGNMVAHFDGMTWNVAAEFDAHLVDLWGSSSRDVFAVGFDSSIVRYDGTTWTTRTLANPYPTGRGLQLNGVWGSSATDVWVVGYTRIPEENRGAAGHYDGVAWQVTPIAAMLDDVWGTGATDVFAAGWRRTPTGELEGVILHFDGTGWALQWTGGDWVPMIHGCGPNDVYALSYAGDYGLESAGWTLLHYEGTTWNAASNLTVRGEEGLHGLWCDSSTGIYAVGKDGGILRYDGSSWAPQFTEIQWPSASLESVWGSSAGDVYIVGRDSTALRFDGTRWLRQQIPSGRDLHGIWGSSGANLFAVGEQGTILHFDGTAWREDPRVTDRHLNGLWGSSSQDVFAVGTGVILHYDGNVWTEQTIETQTQLNGVWGSSPSDVFAVGGEGTILHYDGEIWIAQTVPGDVFLYGIWGSSPTDVIAVGSGATVLRYDGVQWSADERAMSGLDDVGLRLLSDVWGSSASDVFVVGSGPNGGNTLLHFDGTSWTLVTNPATADLLSVWGTVTDVYAVGGRGTVLHGRR
jgi:hypothetical protein